MSNTINVNRNDGIINTGHDSVNQIHNANKEAQKTDDINWETLKKEISILKSQSDLPVKKFAYEAEVPAEKEDKQGILNVLAKWIPCIADLISSSYYIIEIAKNFSIE